MVHVLALITLASLGFSAYLLKQRKGLNLFTDKDIELREREIELEVETRMKKEEKRIREDAISKSRSTIRGQAVEKYISLDDSFKKYNPSDARFLGSPVDYVIFNGVSDVLDGKKDVEVSISLVDVKTNKATLSKGQQKIKEAIEAGRVNWETIHLDPTS